MHESDERFLERFLVEIQPVVQPLGQVTGAHVIEAPGGRRVCIQVAVDGRLGRIELVLEGASLLEAAAGFEASIAEANLALAFREVVLT
jgi:hypothetical protein